MSKQKTFAALVHERLKDGPLSLRAVCRESGLDPSYFSKAVRGKCPPPTDEKVLTRLAKTLDMDPIPLIISTGIIPSILKPAMENPEILQRLIQGRALKRKDAPIQKSPELSEDLL